MTLGIIKPQPVQLIENLSKQWANKFAQASYPITLTIKAARVAAVLHVIKPEHIQEAIGKPGRIPKLFIVPTIPNPEIYYTIYSSANQFNIVQVDRDKPDTLARRQYLFVPQSPNAQLIKFRVGFVKADESTPANAPIFLDPKTGVEIYAKANHEGNQEIPRGEFCSRTVRHTHLQEIFGQLLELNKKHRFLTEQERRAISELQQQAELSVPTSAHER